MEYEELLSEMIMIMIEDEELFKASSLKGLRKLELPLGSL